MFLPLCLFALCFDPSHSLAPLPLPKNLPTSYHACVALLVQVKVKLEVKAKAKARATAAALALTLAESLASTLTCIRFDFSDPVIQLDALLRSFHVHGMRN